MQQQQQQADFDLLAVFPDESKAETATAKLRKEGFTDDEVYQQARATVGQGEFREHGPSANSNLFLQTRRVGPRPAQIALFALIAAVVLGIGSFGATFALATPILIKTIVVIAGVIIGLVVGSILGSLLGRRVQGDIGQNRRRPNAPPPAASVPRSAENDRRTVVAVRLPDPDNIQRKSRARAILLNNGGKIDRSVGRRE